MRRNNALPRAQKPQDTGWFRIRNVGTTAQVHIYNEIGLGGITAEKFKADLDGITAPQIELRINSIGGDVYDGITIHNALKQHPAEVNITVDGVAASIASVIAMAGDTVTMARGSQMMIHDAFTAAVGNAKHLRDQADLLDRFSDTISAFYADRAGGAPEQWRERMRAETWYDADEAVKAGLADNVVQPSRELKARFDLSVFNYAGRHAAPAPELQPATPTAPVIPVPRNTSKTSRPAGTTKTAARDTWADLTGPLLNPPSTGDAGLLAALLEAR